MTNPIVTEAVARAIVTEIVGQTEASWPTDWNDEQTVGLVDAHLDFPALAAAAILAMTQASESERYTNPIAKAEAASSVSLAGAAGPKVDEVREVATWLRAWAYDSGVKYDALDTIMQAADLLDSLGDVEG